MNQGDVSKNTNCACTGGIDLKKVSLEQVNTWRKLGKHAKEHLDIYYGMYKRKLPRRQIKGKSSVKFKTDQ